MRADVKGNSCAGKTGVLGGGVTKEDERAVCRRSLSTQTAGDSRKTMRITSQERLDQPVTSAVGSQRSMMGRGGNGGGGAEVEER